MTTIAKFGNIQDADLARSRLESAGIEVFTPDDVGGSMMLGAMPLASGIRLQVDEKDAARALEILSEPASPAGEEVA